MNKANAKYYLPLVLALAEGKQLQILGDSLVWRDVDDPLLNLEVESYRIKPEPVKPREFWMAITSEGMAHHASPNLMGIKAIAPIGGSIIRVREILD